MENFKVTFGSVKYSLARSALGLAAAGLLIGGMGGLATPIAFAVENDAAAETDQQPFVDQSALLDQQQSSESNPIFREDALNDIVEDDGLDDLVDNAVADDAAYAADVDTDVMAEAVAVSDASLRACINATLSTDPGSPREPDAVVTVEEALSLTALDCEDQTPKITSVAGLESFTNLTELGLRANEIVDVSPLEGLSNLATLDLAFNEVGAVPNLENLTSLGMLSLGFNRLVDVPQLSSSSLTSLDLSNNEIASVETPLGLPNLIYLDLRWNGLSQVPDLQNLAALRLLNLRNNAIVDVSPLAGNVGLTELYLDDNRIVDVSALATLTGLVDLTLSDQKVDLSTEVDGPSGMSLINVGGTFVMPSVSSGAPAVFRADGEGGGAADSGFTYDPATGQWTFSQTGNKTLTWSVAAQVGSAEGEWSGTINQIVTEKAPEPEPEPGPGPGPGPEPKPGPTPVPDTPGKPGAHGGHLAATGGQSEMALMVGVGALLVGSMMAGLRRYRAQPSS